MVLPRKRSGHQVCHSHPVRFCCPDMVSASDLGICKTNADSRFYTNLPKWPFPPTLLSCKLDFLLLGGC